MRVRAAKRHFMKGATVAKSPFIPLHLKGPLVQRARKGALPVAEQATAAIGQPLALTARSAGRQGLAATRGHGEAMTEGLSPCCRRKF